MTKICNWILEPSFVNLNYSSQILGSSTLTSYCTMPPLLHTCQFPFGPVKSIMLTSVTLVAMGTYIVIRVKLRDLVCWLSYREATTGLGSIAVPMLMHGHFDFDSLILLSTFFLEHKYGLSRVYVCVSVLVVPL